MTIRSHFNLSEKEYLELTKECIICGVKKAEKTICLHHIRAGAPYLNVKFNFVALCHRHHGDIHFKKTKKKTKEILRKILIKKYGYDLMKELGKVRLKRNGIKKKSGPTKEWIEKNKWP